MYYIFTTVLNITAYFNVELYSRCYGYKSTDSVFYRYFSVRAKMYSFIIMHL